MLVLIGFLLALVPAVAILYPLLRRSEEAAHEDEGSTSMDLRRRWESAISGLRNTELEWSIGNLADEDYSWLKRGYMDEAVLVMKAMELEEQQEQEMLAEVELEIDAVRQGISGPEDDAPERKAGE